MPERDLDLMITAARSAGELALTFFEGANRVWDKGHDDPVSDADLAVNDHLREALTTARPDHGWLSEESEDNKDRLSKERVFIVDPIDGTRAFIAGRKTWAHSIGLCQHGAPVAGVVYLPALDLMYAASTTQPATKNGEMIDGSGPLSNRPIQLLSNKHALGPSYWPSGLPAVEQAFRPSLAYRLCLVAEGRFDAMVTFRDSWEWDIAAGAIIASRAGCCVGDRDGNALGFNARHPATPGLIAGSPDAFSTLISARREP